MRAGVAILLLLVAAAPARGQVSELRVRQAIEDGARGLGQAVAGGSPQTGPAATTGGLGHFRLALAATVTSVEIEDPRRATGTVDFLLPVGTAQAAVGLWDAPGPFGSIDLLGRIGPVITTAEIAESAPLLSLGVRVGIVDEGLVLPAVSASAYQSWVDGLEYGEDEGEVSFDANVRSLSGRVDVSKGFLLVTPYAGVGFDRTEIEADYLIPAQAATGGETIRGTIETAGTHPKAYAGVEFSLLLLSAAAEVGTYDGGPFGALAIRIGR